MPVIRLRNRPEPLRVIHGARPHARSAGQSQRLIAGVNSEQASSGQCFLDPHGHVFASDVNAAESKIAAFKPVADSIPGEIPITRPAHKMKFSYRNGRMKQIHGVDGNPGTVTVDPENDTPALEPLN